MSLLKVSALKAVIRSATRVLNALGVDDLAVNIKDPTMVPNDNANNQHDSARSDPSRDQNVSLPEFLAYVLALIIYYSAATNKH